MRKASPRVRILARRLAQTGAPGADATSETPADACQRSWEPLRLQLTQLVGAEGFQALLSRALALAKGEPERCVLIDATRPKAGVAEQIWREVNVRFDPATAPVQLTGAAT